MINTGPILLQSTPAFNNWWTAPPPASNNNRSEPISTSTDDWKRLGLVGGPVPSRVTFIGIPRSIAALTAISKGRLHHPARLVKSGPDAAWIFGMPLGFWTARPVIKAWGL